MVGLSLLAARFLGWIAAAGAMTLSLYTVHVLALATKAGIDDRPALLLIHAVLALLAGLFWVTLFDRGPLEQLLARTSAARPDCRPQRSQTDSITALSSWPKSPEAC